jgi:hypothetical protein
MDEIEARVTALEGQMTTRVGALENQVKAIRSDAAAARVLAGGADRDVSGFHAKLDTHKGLIEALRQTQIDHGTKLDVLQKTVVGQGVTLAVHSEKLDEHGAKLDEHGRRLDRIESQMQAGFAKVDKDMQANYAKLAAGQALITDLLTRHLGEPDN